MCNDRLSDVCCAHERSRLIRGGGAVTAEAAGKVALSRKKVTVTYGKSTTVQIKNVSRGKKILWSTSNKNVAAIRANGSKVLITAKKKGSATITAKVDAKKYTCKVTVKDAPKINKTAIKLNYGKTYTLTVSGTASNPKWSVKNKKIAAIQKVNPKSYKITARAKGTTYVYAKVSGKTLKCKVVVKETPKLSKSSLSLTKGKMADLVLYGTGATAKWTTSNASVVKIKKISNIKYRLGAVKAGKAIISCKVSGKTLKCIVTVKEPANPVDTTNPNIEPNVPAAQLPSISSAPMQNFYIDQAAGVIKVKTSGTVWTEMSDKIFKEDEKRVQSGYGRVYLEPVYNLSAADGTPLIAWTENRQYGNWGLVMRTRIAYYRGSFAGWYNKSGVKVKVYRLRQKTTYYNTDGTIANESYNSTNNDCSPFEFKVCRCGATFYNPFTFENTVLEDTLGQHRETCTYRDALYTIQSFY